MGKLQPLLLENNSDWLKKAERRRKNRGWLKKAAMVAIKILCAMRSQDINQKKLAEKMNVSPQYVSRIIKGQENLTLETIDKLETILNISIL